MGEEQTFQFKMTIPGAEWWYHAAVLSELVTVNEDEVIAVTANAHGGTLKFTGIVGTTEKDGVLVNHTDIIATFEFATKERGVTTVIGHGLAGEAERWVPVLKQLNKIARAARGIRTTSVGTTPDEAIEYYYRVRAAGSTITLRELAKHFELSYEALRKHKQRYDAAGKWGSKKGQDVS